MILCYKGKLVTRKHALQLAEDYTRKKLGCYIFDIVHNDKKMRYIFDLFSPSTTRKMIFSIIQGFFRNYVAENTWQFYCLNFGCGGCPDR